ncbi:MAG TPA: HIT domain-containing protein [Candidatus Saccharimonadales bacterium]|nr:HIT domain-containing protein [Candidatus Saccharimonadales bacterium]
MNDAGEGRPDRYIHPDPFQQMWDNPGQVAEALFVNEHFMVRPDDMPVAPHHLLVIAREQRSVEDLSFAHQQAMWALAMVVYGHMARVLQPKLKVGISVWGNMIQTGHIHLVPRNSRHDAAVWHRMELPAAELHSQLAETRRLLEFPTEVTAQANFAVEETLQRLGNVTLPVLPDYPARPTSGE